MNSPAEWIKYNYGIVDPKRHDTSGGIAVILDPGCKFTPESAAKAALSWTNIELSMASRPCHYLDGDTDRGVMLDRLPKWGEYLSESEGSFGVREDVPSWSGWCVVQSSIKFYHRDIASINIKVVPTHDSHARFAPTPYMISGRITLS